MKRILVAALACGAITLITGCASTVTAPNGDPVAGIVGEGTVHKGVGPECPNVWHVATVEGGVMLWPVEDPALQVEGTRVRFSARERSGEVSICMAGKFVEFIRLEKL